MQTVTVSRILLCSTHIVPDTTPPPSDEDTSPLPVNTPLCLSPCCDLDVRLTTSALLENLEAGVDPFHVGPAIHDPVEPSLTFPSPAATSPKVVGPIRRRRKTTARQGMEDNMYQRYQDVLAEVNNSGDSQQSDLNLWCLQIYLFASGDGSRRSIWCTPATII